MREILLYIPCFYRGDVIPRICYASVEKLLVELCAASPVRKLTDTITASLKTTSSAAIAATRLEPPTTVLANVAAASTAGAHAASAAPAAVTRHTATKSAAPLGIAQTATQGVVPNTDAQQQSMQQSMQRVPPAPVAEVMGRHNDSAASAAPIPPMAPAPSSMQRPASTGDLRASAVMQSAADSVPWTATVVGASQVRLTDDLVTTMCVFMHSKRGQGQKYCEFTVSFIMTTVASVTT